MQEALGFIIFVGLCAGIWLFIKHQKKKTYAPKPVTPGPGPKNTEPGGPKKTP